MEEVIRSNPLVSNCTVIAEGRERVAALIELNFEYTKDYCLETVFEKGLSFFNYISILHHV